MASGGFLKDFFICTFCVQNGLLNSIHDRKQDDMTCIEDRVSFNPKQMHTTGSAQ